jgi:hypothetical protein
MILKYLLLNHIQTIHHFLIQIYLQIHHFFQSDHSSFPSINHIEPFSDSKSNKNINSPTQIQQSKIPNALTQPQFVSNTKTNQNDSNKSSIPSSSFKSDVSNIKPKESPDSQSQSQIKETLDFSSKQVNPICLIKRDFVSESQNSLPSLKIKN